MLYHSTLIDSNAKAAIVGKFIAAGGKTKNNNQQIITLSATGNALCVFTHDPDMGSVTLLHKHHTHCQVRQIRSFRLPGLKKDYVITTSDSGALTLLEFKSNRFTPLHRECHGRSGVRRVVPGEFLAVDTKGRACMTASVEKSKLVFVLNRQGSEIEISSPLEAHVTGAITCFLVSCDVGYENPVFAAVESHVTEGSHVTEFGVLTKQLVFYELDLGLNHVIRKAPVDVPNSVSHVTAVPGEDGGGPGGVLVFSTNTIVHHVMGGNSSQSVKIPLPRSATGYDNIVITCALHQSRDLFFYIAQNTRGDLFKISRDQDSGTWRVLYFGRIAVCSSLTILKSGHMICLSEQGDSHVMFFESLGDDEDDVSSNVYEVAESAYLHVTQTLFQRKPVFDAVTNHVNGVLQITSATKNSLKITCNALTPTVIVASPLPEPPAKIWTMKNSTGYDQFIVLSYANATLVLEIGESVVETTGSGLVLTKPTIHCGRVGRNYVQVMSDGMVVIADDESRADDSHVHEETSHDNQSANPDSAADSSNPDLVADSSNAATASRDKSRDQKNSEKSRESTTWTPPPDDHVICASSSSHQVVLGLTSSLVYFEDSRDSELTGYDGNYPLSSPPIAVAVAPVPAGRLRAPFLAVATEDETVRIVSCDPETMFETVAVQGLMSRASSLALLSVGHVTYLHLALTNGVYVRCELDHVTGEILGSWSKFIGLGRLSVVPVTCGGKNENNKNSVLVVSRGVKTCLGHVTESDDTWAVTGGNSAPFYALDAISGDPLDLAHSFETRDCPNGVIGVAGSTLKIFKVDTLTKWTEQEVKMEGTCKRLSQLEGDTLVVTEEPNRVNHVRGGEVVMTKQLAGVPTAISHVEFDGKMYVAVGGSRDEDEGSRDRSRVSPGSRASGYISIFTSSLTHVHTTHVEHPPLALTPYNGLLIAGIGAQIRLYALGLKQLLRKAQIEISKRVTCLDVFPGSNRIAAGDIRQSVTVLVVQEQGESGHVIYPLVCDKIARQVTCLRFVDHLTLAAGDRFGGFTMLRIPAEAAKLADEDFSAVHLRQLEPTLNGSAHYRFDHVVSFHLEDVPVSISQHSGLLIVCSLLGTVTALAAIPTDKEARHLKTIEKFVAESDPGLMARDHLRFRGYYVPVKDVVDGDLLDEFLTMEKAARVRVAEKSGLGVDDVVGRIGNMQKVVR